MRQVRIKSLVAILTLIAAGMLRAETIIPAKLSLNDAVRLSMGMNVSLKSAVEAQKASLSDLRIAKFNTTYSAGSNLNIQHSSSSTGLSQLVFSDLNYANPIGTEAVLRLSPLGVGNQFGAVGLLVRQPLLKGKGNLSTRGLQLLGAQSDVTIRNHELYRAQQTTVMNVIEAYYGAVLARERLKVQEDAVTIAQEVADGTRKREAAGLMTGIQVTRADFNVARTKDSFNIQSQSTRGSLDRLMLAIGGGIGETPDLTDPLPEVVPDPPALEEAIKTAIIKRPELRVLDERIANQTRDLSVRKDAFRPGLNAVARFDSTNPDKGLISGSLFDMGSTVLGVEFNVPLDQRALRENHDTAERTLAILQEQQNFEMDQITEEVRGAYREVETAKLSFQIYGQNLAVAEDGLRLAKRMVEEGEGSNRDILDAQDALTSTQSGVLSAKTDLYLAGIRLRYAMGEDLMTMGSK
jgi:outer membrane protein TolC